MGNVMTMMIAMVLSDYKVEAWLDDGINVAILGALMATDYNHETDRSSSPH